jgi:hypothetical protein
MMDELQFKLLSDKMDTIIKLLAMNAVEGKGLKDQVLMLSSFGFQPKHSARRLITLECCCMNCGKRELTKKKARTKPKLVEPEETLNA